MSDKIPRDIVGDVNSTPAAAAGAPGVGAPDTAASLVAVTEVASRVRAACGLPESAVRIQRATRLWIDVDQAGFPAVFEHLVKEQGFTILCTITGADLGTDLGFIYHLARDGGVMANVKTHAPKGTAIRTITPYFPGAANYERELEDLLGATVEGKPQGPRYPLPENWPAGDHPLLKDWQPKQATPRNTAGVAAAGQGDATNE